MHMVAGGFDYLIKVRTSDMEHYRMFLAEKLSTIGGDKKYPYVCGYGRN